jgi:hypothetical protein
MPVPVPTEPPVQSTGVLSWAEGDRTHPRLLAEVKDEWSCTSAAPCMLSWRGQDTTLPFISLQLHSWKCVNLIPATIIVAFTFVFVLCGCEMWVQET